jgi:hypothetical protein
MEEGAQKGRGWICSLAVVRGVGTGGSSTDELSYESVSQGDVFTGFEEIVTFRSHLIDLAPILAHG